MRMTENEAKGCIQGKLDCMIKCDVFDCKGTEECDSCSYCYSQGTFGEQKKAFDIAIKALNEIQHYRAIGTIEEIKALKEKKGCEMCGCIMEDSTDSTICECCLDDMRKEDEE